MKQKKQPTEESCNEGAEDSHLTSHLEVFAKAVAEGSSHVEAAVICGRKRGSASFLYAQPGVKQRIAELRTIKQRANEKALAETANGMRYPRVTVTRNHIINGLAHEARTAKSACARVSAWQVLADIYLLRARNIREVADFCGWTDEDLDEYIKNGILPARFRNLVDSSKSVGLPIDRKTGRITNKVTDRGVQEEQHPRAG